MPDKNDDVEVERKRKALLENPDCAWNDDGSVTLRLHVPIVFGGNEEPITELRVRRPKAKDYKKASSKNEKGLDVSIKVIAMLTGQFETRIDELDIYDMNVIGDIIELFSVSSDPTGVNGSER